VWLTLVFFLASVVGGTTVLALYAMRTFSALRETGDRTIAALEEVAQTAAEIEGRASSLGERTAELDQSLARLRASRAQLAVLTDELRGVQGAVRFAAAARPRK
jgi:hypothetical protein